MIEEHDHQYRVGIGTDIHQFVEDKQLMLCGIAVPFPYGLLGHSDGDVVLHSVMDALLGASGNGDIGTYFPDTDPRYKGADSSALLLLVKQVLDSKQWVIVNIDVTIHAEQPRLEAYKAQMKRKLADLLGIDFTAVNIKAKTNEGLGPVGEGEAIEATAIAMIRKKIKRTL